MSAIISDVFTHEIMEYIQQHPEVIAAKAKLVNSRSVYFNIPLTESIKTTLQERFGLDFSSVTHVPMRWMKGDTTPHIDSGAAAFEHTYLVYLNDSEGAFVIGEQEHPISANTGYVFNEGLMHKTQDTGTEPRLLLGPMNEFAEPVGAPLAIYYYNNYADAFAQAGNYIAYNTTNYVLGSIDFGSIAPYTSWRVASWTGIGAPPSGVYANGFDLSTFGIEISYYVYPAAPCFLEGTQLLCLVDGEETYRPIESLRKGDLVKTSRDGYKKVELLGKGELHNPGTYERTEHRLYKCTPAKYPELTSDLYITGCHSILVDTLTDAQRESTKQHLGSIFVTDKKYRLITCIDERAEPWNSEGHYTIWHLALEAPNDVINYGIYANGGLLVETCCLRRLKQKSNMSIIL